MTSKCGRSRENEADGNSATFVKVEQGTDPFTEAVTFAVDSEPGEYEVTLKEATAGPVQKRLKRVPI